MGSNISTTPSKYPAHLEKFFAEKDPQVTRIAFVLDATASRQETWDKASALTAQMFQAAAAGGGIEMQLTFFRGANECTSTRWVSDPAELSRIMSKVMCRSGYTQFQRAFKHVGKEHQRQPIAAVIAISDAFEENQNSISLVVREFSGLPVFMFQEGDDPETADAYRKIVEITKGAHCQFDNSSAARLADLLRAVVAFAIGGIKALAGQNTAAAKLLLTQMK